MARVSDEKLATLEAPYLLGDIGTTVDVILDLRDARALLAWIERECRREYHSPEDLQRTILAELEGYHEQG